MTPFPSKYSDDKTLFLCCCKQLEELLLIDSLLWKSPLRWFLTFLKEMNRSKPGSELPEEELNIHGHTKEVDIIVQALSDDSSSAVTGVLVSGIAGVGKSTVAIQSGHQLNDKFQRVVKFCSLRGEHSKREEMEKNKNELDGELREILNVCVPGHQQTSENPRHVLLAWCRRLEYELILLIDNAEDAMEDHSRGSFIKLLKDMRTCSDRKIKFLITSRRSDIDSVTTGLNIKVVEVGPLDSKESIDVLKDGADLWSHTGRETQVKLERIAELCENIPLALRLAGPLLSSDSEYTFDELITELENNPTKALGLERMMEVAFEKLDEPLKHALVCLSVFARSFDRDAAKALLGVNCADHLMKLKKRCLIQKQQNRYLIHLLIRGFAKQIGKTDKFRHILAHGQKSFAEYFLSLMLTNSEKYWGKDTCKESFDLFNKERLNLESTLRVVGRKKIRNCRELEDMVSSCQRVAPYIEYCVPFQLYDNFLEGLLHFAENQKKLTNQVEILLLLYHESRKHGGVKTRKSQDLIRQATQLHDKNRQHFKEESLSEIFYLSHYGRYFSQDCNQREKAQSFLEEAISIYEQEKHGAAFDKARILGQMGHNAKLHKDGVRHDEALGSYLEAFRFRQEHFGQHLLTAFARKELADYYLYIEDFDKAEKHYNEAISVLKSMERLEQKEAIPIFKNFGICYQESGKLDQAQTMFEIGSGVADSTIEGNHKWKVWIKTKLAVLLYKKCPDDVAGADNICKEVLKMGKDLGLEGWPAKEELEKLYKKD